jgi:hypothetical protein
MIRGRETQEGPVNRPIACVVIKTSPSVDPLFDFLRDMRVAEDDDLKPF